MLHVKFECFDCLDIDYLDIDYFYWLYVDIDYLDMTFLGTFAWR